MLNSKNTCSGCAKTPDPSISSGLYVKNKTIRVLLDSGSSGDLLFCGYRFSWKPISTYMSLTLARLCGEWRLVRKNYEAPSRKYKAWIVIFRILAADYFYCGISRFWLKYEARIAIFRILAAIDRFSRISRKVESRWGKSESRWGKSESHWGKLESRYGKWKCVKESGKPLKKLESHWRRFSRISRKSESRWRKSNFEKRKSDFGLGKSQCSQRHSQVSGNFGVSFWHQICYHVRAWIYLIGFSVFQLLIT